MESFVEAVRVCPLGGLAQVERMFDLAIGFGLLVVIPLTAMLLAHQRRMAELINRKHTDEAVLDRVKRLEVAISLLTERVNDLTLAIDDRAHAELQPPDTAEN